MIATSMKEKASRTDGGLSLMELVLFGVGGAILGSWRFAEIGAYRGALVGVVANLVVSRLLTVPTPRAFFFGFVICGFTLGLVIPLQLGGNRPRAP